MGYNTSGYHRFFGSGTETIRITNTGNVGIGTTSPGSKLTVSGPSNAASNTPSQAIVDIVGSSTAHLLMGTASASPYGAWINTDATGQPLILQGPGGNVGIGTTSPGYKLDVSSSARITNELWLNAQDQASLIFQQSSNSKYNIAYNTSGYLQFYNYVAGGASMVINNSGNVGIGTTSPLEKLNIVETTATAGTFFPVAISGARYQADYGVGIAFRPENNSSAYANKTAIVGSGGGYGYGMADLHFCFNNSTTISDEVSLSDSKVVFKRSGNVGIGTLYPAGAGTNLQVNSGSHSQIAAHFGQGQNNSSGVFGGISLGYTEANDNYRKVAIVAKALADSAARQNLHFLVDTVSDGGSANLADSKMMIDGLTGNVGIGHGFSAPGSILHIAGASPEVRIATTADGETARLGLYEDTAGYNHGGYIQYVGNGDTLRLGLVNSNVDIDVLTMTDTGNATFAGDIYLNSVAATLTIGETSETDSTTLWTNNSDTFYVQQDAAGAKMQFDTDQFTIKKVGASENVAIFAADGAVKLYYNASKKFETTDAGATVTGDLQVDGIVLDAANIELDTSLAANKTSGTIIRIGSESSMTFGKCYALTSAGTGAGTWEETDPTDENFSKQLLGIALGTDANVDGMLTTGVFYDASHSFTVGEPLYLSTTAGTLTTTAPNTSGDLIRVVGYAIDANHIYFCPDNTWVILD